MKRPRGESWRAPAHDREGVVQVWAGGTATLGEEGVVAYKPRTPLTALGRARLGRIDVRCPHTNELINIFAVCATPLQLLQFPFPVNNLFATYA
jgi:hypothetical protein